MVTFSIIIPVYNGAGYLEKCIESIDRQSCQDFEIIIVDDGSCDSSWKLALSLSEENKRIRCYRIAHSGAGAARNAGVIYAEGEYILFLDADDYWVDKKFLEKLKAMILQHHTDVFMFRMVKVTEKGTVLKRYQKPLFFHDNMVLKLEDVYSELVKDGQALASACNKCVRRSLLKRYAIAFKEDVMAEDIDWVIQLFSYVRTICLLNIDVYAYTQHRTESRSTSKDGPNDLVSMIEHWSRLLNQGKVPHARAVAGLVAFEYGICMGNHQLLSPEKRKIMRSHEYLLKYGLDQKTKLIYCFYRIVGYSLTCTFIRIYLFGRRLIF